MQIIGNLRRTVAIVGALIASSALVLSACSGDSIPEAQPQPQESAAKAPQESEQEPQEQTQAQPVPSEDEQPQADSAVPAESAETDQSTAQPSAQEQEEPAAEASEQSEAQPQQEAGQSSRPLPRSAMTFLPRDATETAEGIPIIRDSERPRYFGLDWETLWGIRLVDLEEFSQGAARDAIPALSGPLYVTLEEASTYYSDDVPLVQVNVAGDVRGFPLEIMTWHEIVNDTIGGVPVVVTFCPLCNTAIAFESQIGEEVFKFGVSGLLRNSDLVMYDRNSESLWQQSSGRALVGAMVGARLKYVGASVVSLGQLRDAYPDALVMSRETGWFREYGQNPYRGYDDPERGGPYSFFFDRESVDERLPPAERVVSIEGPSGAAIAYAWSHLQAEGVVQDSFDGIELVVFWTPGVRSALDDGFIARSRDVGTTAVFESTLDGRALTFAPNPNDPAGQTFIDAESGSVWDIFGRAVEGELAGSRLTRVIHSDHFWFAWQAFHPDTEVVAVVDG